MSGSDATVVVKLGGNAVGSGAGPVAADVAALVADGTRVVVVHGGGPQTSALQEALGQTPRKVAGRRVTDEATLDAIKMVVGGKINVDLCAALLKAGAKPIGLHGASSCALSAERRPPTKYVGHDAPVDLGFVGDVTGVNLSLLSLLCDAGHVPVMACIGANERGEIYNINADVVAGKVAALLKATALVMVSDIRAVLRDVSDPESRIAEVTAAEGEALIADGVVTEGMIPKIEEAFATIAAGVRRVTIAGRLVEGELLASVRQPGSVGTTLVP